MIGPEDGKRGDGGFVLAVLPGCCVGVALPSLASIFHFLMSWTVLIAVNES